MVSSGEIEPKAMYHIPGHEGSFDVAAKPETSVPTHEWDATRVALLLGHIGHVLAEVRANPDAPELPVIPPDLITQEDVDLAA